MNVGLFSTCAVDLFRPSVAWAAVALLEEAGCSVDVPAQTCCGQVAYNTGNREATRDLAWDVVQRFESFDYVVAPSGSCAGMLRRHYPALFAADDPRRERVEKFSAKVHELTSFLADVLDFVPAAALVDLSATRVTYHDSCAGLRELGVQSQPRSLLRTCANVRVEEMTDTGVCCGFGGTFCVKYPEISTRMARDKLANARRAGAELLLGGDLSCLLLLAGTVERDADENGAGRLELRHVAEALAGRLDSPAIGQPAK